MYQDSPLTQEQLTLYREKSKELLDSINQQIKDFEENYPIKITLFTEHGKKLEQFLNEEDKLTNSYTLNDSYIKETPMSMVADYLYKEEWPEGDMDLSKERSEVYVNISRPLLGNRGLERYVRFYDRQHI